MGLKKEKVIISKKAQEAIKEIFDYTKRTSSPETAQKVKSAIIHKCKDLKNFSGYSKEEFLDELEGDYRSVTIWSYVIIFRVTEKTIRVLKVVHASQHPDKRREIE